MKKYRLYCETDNKDEFVISDSEPTQCPHDAVHTIRSESVCIVDDDVQVNDGTPKDLPLDDYKQLRINEIDARTQELIFSNGFTFDTKNFSMSSVAQANWIGLKTMEALLTFPIEITTRDDEAYSLTQANLDSFCGTALATKQGHLDSGRALKIQIKSCTTEAEIDAIVDNR